MAQSESILFILDKIGCVLTEAFMWETGDSQTNSLFIRWHLTGQVHFASICWTSPGAAHVRRAEAVLCLSPRVRSRPDINAYGSVSNFTS